MRDVEPIDRQPQGLLIEEEKGSRRLAGILSHRGMTSPEAVVAGASDEGLDDALSTPAEGQSLRVPYVGSVVGILDRVRGHLQSAVSYAGEPSLVAAHRKLTADPERYLIPLSEASPRESFAR